jgi:hypothetical protein
MNRPLLPSLAPIYVALLSILSLSLLGFVVASWPGDAASSAPRPAAVEAATASRSIEAVPPAPLKAPEPRSRKTWM